MQQLEFKSLAEQFETAFTAVGGKFHRVANFAGAVAKLGAIAEEVKAKTAVAWDTPLLRKLLSSQDLDVHFTEEQPDRAKARQLFRERALGADLGITGTDFALADTGSLVVLSKPGQPRVTSLLPPRHIAIVREEDLVANLEELFAVLRARGADLVETLTSSMSIITGSSRTSDIEKILFLGMHGPLEVHVIYLEAE